MENEPQENLIEVNYQPYFKRDFFSPSEAKFYKVLASIINDGYLLFPKVRICDLIESKYGPEKYLYFNKIKSKHVDFVICSKNPVEPKIVIELDGYSHNRYDRQARDQFVDEAFANANIPILHVKVAHEYDRNELARKINETLLVKYSVKTEYEPQLDSPEEKHTNTRIIVFVFIAFYLIFMAIAMAYSK